MRATLLLALVLIAGGIAGLAIPHFAYTQQERVVEVGPVTIEADKKKHVNIPQIAAIGALVAGLVLLFASNRAPSA